MVEFDTLDVICFIGELEDQYLCILFGLLQTITSSQIVWLCFNNDNEVITGITEQIISPLLWSAFDLIASENYTAVSKGNLLIDPVGLIIPAGASQLGEHEFSAGISFVTHKGCRKQENRH